MDQTGMSVLSFASRGLSISSLLHFNLPLRHKRHFMVVGLPDVRSWWSFSSCRSTTTISNARSPMECKGAFE